METTIGVAANEDELLFQGPPRAEATVSIVIPALNESDRIVEAVDLAWDAGADEVIVVDGGSSDDTASRAGRRAVVITSEPSRALQQNAGAEEATGDILLFQHADNWLETGAVDQVRRALADPQVQAGAFVQRIDSDGWLYRLLESGNAWRVRVLGLPYGDQGIFVRRSVFFELGGFPEVRLMEDLLLMRKLRQQSRPVLLPGPLNVDARRWQKHGVIRQTVRNWLLLAAEKAGVSPDRLAEYYPRHDREA